MKTNTITIKHSFIVSSEYLQSFLEDLKKILSDPGYPEQVHLLAESFYQLAQKGLLEILKQYNKYNKFLKKIEGLDPTYEEEYVRREKESSFKQIKLIFKYFKYLSGLTRYILSSSIEIVPIGLLYPFEKIIERLAPKSYIFLRKQWKHNYKYGEFVSQILDPAEKPDYFDYIKDEFNFRLCMVSFPSLEDDNYSYNCNIAHEVGHYINDLDQFIRPVKDFLKQENLRVEQIDDVKIQTHTRKVALIWHGEFIADVYASFLVGPAYLFSFLEFYGSEKELDKFYVTEENEYPSIRMRLFYILRTLEYHKHNVKSYFQKSEDDWFEHVYKKLDQYSKWIYEDMFKFDRDEESLIGEIAWKANKEICSKVIEHAYNTLFKPKDGIAGFSLRIKDEFNSKVLNQVNKKLIQGIPINEIHKDIEFRDGKGNPATHPMKIFSILNYGWMRFFELIEGQDKEEEKIRESVKNLRLLIKRSVEASYFHEQYNEHKSRL
jgi:hypothetical protein